jgi:hypothetical protein
VTGPTTQSAQDAACSLDLRPGRGVSRIAVLLVVGCVGVHLAGVAQHWSMTPFWSAAMLVASAACLVCVPHLWSAPTVRSWVGAVVGFAVMFALHLVMLVQMRSAATAGGVAGHDGHAMGATVAGPGFDPLTAAGLLLPALGVAWAWWVLGRVQRRSVWPTPA